MAQNDDFFRAFKEQILLTINTAFPAIVVSAGNGSATIQPQFMQKRYGEDPVKLPIIENVPVLKYRFAGMSEQALLVQPGDVVYCVCSQRSLDDVMSGQVHYAGKSRVLSLQDAVITGVIKFANSGA